MLRVKRRCPFGDDASFQSPTRMAYSPFEATMQTLMQSQQPMVTSTFRKGPAVLAGVENRPPVSTTTITTTSDSSSCSAKPEEMDTDHVFCHVCAEMTPLPEELQPTNTMPPSVHCRFCEKVTCSECARLCTYCHDVFCSFCCTPNYDLGSCDVMVCCSCEASAAGSSAMDTS